MSGLATSFVWMCARCACIDLILSSWSLARRRRRPIFCCGFFSLIVGILSVRYCWSWLPFTPPRLSSSSWCLDAFCVPFDIFVCLQLDCFGGAEGLFLSPYHAMVDVTNCPLPLQNTRPKHRHRLSRNSCGHWHKYYNCDWVAIRSLSDLMVYHVDDNANRLVTKSVFYMIIRTSTFSMEALALVGTVLLCVLCASLGAYLCRSFNSFGIQWRPMRWHN